MQLSELSLDRYLYRLNGQVVNANGDSVVDASGNIVTDPVPSVAAGGAAQDVNTGNMPITGILFQSSEKANVGIKISEDLGGINIYGTEALKVLTSDGVLVGFIKGYSVVGGMILSIDAGDNNLTLLGNAGIIVEALSGPISILANNGIILDPGSGNNISVSEGSILPMAITPTYAVGSSTQRWAHIYTVNVDADYGIFAKNIRLTSTSTPDTTNGSIYFDGAHFYGRISGVWKQLDN